jgi:cobaltochelatase CobN
VYAPRRNIVVRPDGRLVNVARARGHLFVCESGCCCGRTADGFASVPAETFHLEWERRRLRNQVHLTIGGCLGPCALANVALLLFDGQAQWFHSVTGPAMANAIWDHVERMLEADRCLPPPPGLAPYHFTGSRWQPRPDGQPLDDHRPWRRADEPLPHACGALPSGVSVDGVAVSVDGLVANMQGRVALPRRNGELVFDEPWHGRVFGMAVALHEEGVYDWEEFRQALIRQVAVAEARGGAFVYYEVWLTTFEELLAGRGIVRREELDEAAFQFEFGERDEVF